MGETTGGALSFSGRAEVDSAIFEHLREACRFASAHQLQEPTVASGRGSSAVGEAILLACLRLREVSFSNEEDSSQSVEGGALAVTERWLSEDEGHGISLPFSVPYFANTDIAYPLPLVLTYTLIMAVLIFVFEALFLRSTLFSKKTSKLMQQMTKDLKDFLSSAFDSESDSDEEGADSKEKRKAQPLKPWEEADVTQFWKRVQTRSLEQLTSEVDQDIDVVGFLQRHFLCRKADGKVTISVVRSGPCKASLEVRVQVYESSVRSHFKAAAGQDFEQQEVAVKFAPGETLQKFDVELIQKSRCWTPTQYFLAQITLVTSGEAVLGGPSIFAFHNGHKGPLVRVLILQAEMFPDNGAPDLPNTASGNVRLMWRYFMERKKDRGIKWWKTLFALLFEPVHHVVVVTWVQKVLLDYACVPQSEVFNNYWAVAGCAIALTVSVILLRWADVSQTRNRGRTAGCRMKHRIDLFSKMLNLDNAEQLEHHNTRWLYTGIVDVDAAVVNGYWECFIMVQNLFALFLSILVLFVSVIFSGVKPGSATKLESFAPTVGMCILMPIALSIIWFRERETCETQYKRQVLEQNWVDSFVYLSQKAQDLHVLDASDTNHLEGAFEQESSRFVKYHQAARDLANDSSWITGWLTNLAFILAMLWGGYRLLRSNLDRSQVMLAGDLLVVLQVYSAFGKYLTKVNTSLVKLMQASVSLRRVADLLNQREHSSLQDCEPDPSVISLDPRVPRTIEFRNVMMKMPELGLCIRMRAGAQVVIPMGKTVSVHCGNLNEGSLLAFMKLVAGVSCPTSGEVIRQSTGLVAMLPQTSFLARHLSVHHRLMLGNLNNEAATRAAQVLGIRPERRCSELLTGEARVLEFFCIMLRDPEVLVLDRPFAFLPQDVRERLASLLSLWQGHGGRRAILRELYQSDSHQGKDSPGKPAHPLLFQRTLIVTSAGMGGFTGDQRSEFADVELNLDELFEVRVIRGEKASRCLTTDLAVCAW